MLAAFRQAKMRTEHQAPSKEGVIMNKKQESRMEDYIEAAFWEFDAARSRKEFSERDHFKMIFRKTIRRIDGESNNWFKRIILRITA